MRYRAARSRGYGSCLGHGVPSTASRCSAWSPLRDQTLLVGAESLSDLELTTLVLAGSDDSGPAAAQIAHVLEASGGLHGAARLGAAGLVSRRLLSIADASRLAAALELGRRALLHSLSEERKVVGSFESVAAWARPRLSGLEHEEVWLLLLDGSNGLKAVSRIAQGGLHGCALTPRDVLRPALRDGASAMVLVHNHPSGDPTPSVEDVEMTRAVAIAGDVVGVPLLDHVVVARGGAASLFAAHPRRGTSLNVEDHPR